MKITPELILSLQSPNGGWSKESLAKLGVPWPPPAGWRKKLEAKHWDRTEPWTDFDSALNRKLRAES